MCSEQAVQDAMASGYFFEKGRAAAGQGAPFVFVVLLNACFGSQGIAPFWQPGGRSVLEARGRAAAVLHAHSGLVARTRGSCSCEEGFAHPSPSDQNRPAKTSKKTRILPPTQPIWP